MTVSRSVHSFPVQHKQCGGEPLCYSIAQGFRSYYVMAFLFSIVQGCPGIIQLAGRREGRGKAHLFMHNFCYLSINKHFSLYPSARTFHTSLVCKGQKTLQEDSKWVCRHLASFKLFSRLCLCLTFSSSLPGSPSFAKLIYPGGCDILNFLMTFIFPSWKVTHSVSDSTNIIQLLHGRRDARNCHLC